MGRAEEKVQIQTHTDLKKIIIICLFIYFIFCGDLKMSKVIQKQFQTKKYSLKTKIEQVD